jgi:hypothetical protein
MNPFRARETKVLSGPRSSFPSEAAALDDETARNQHLADAG